MGFISVRYMMKNSWIFDVIRMRLIESAVDVLNVKHNPVFLLRMQFLVCLPLFNMKSIQPSNTVQFIRR